MQCYRDSTAVTLRDFRVVECNELTYVDCTKSRRVPPCLDHTANTLLKFFGALQRTLITSK